MGNGGRKNRRERGFASRGASRGRQAGMPGGEGGDREKGGLRAAARKEPDGRITPNRRHGFAGGTRPYDYSFYESEPASPGYMARLFARHSFVVTPMQLDRFWIYYDLLRRKNASLDLTRIMGIEATVLKHFIDSALILNWFEPVGPVLDIGSGPGFPGLPLAILRGETEFILAESRAKRVGFLREAVSLMRLENVSIFPRSVREDSPLGVDYGFPLGDVVTRALEAMAPTLGRILPFINPGRQVAFLKGPDCDAEISEALAAFPGIYELADDVEYCLPGTDQRRRLPRFRKLPLG